MAAVKYLSLTGLQYFYGKLEDTFLKINEFPTASTTQLGGIKLESTNPTLTIDSSTGVLSITATNLQNVYGYDPMRLAAKDVTTFVAATGTAQDGVTYYTDNTGATVAEVSVGDDVSSLFVAQTTEGHNGLMSKADKAKLDGLEAGGQVNVIETIKVNGTTQTVTNKAVDITVPTTVAELTDASDYHTVADFNTAIADYSTTTEMNAAIDSAISAVYKPAGSVASVSALPTLSASVLGNVYNLTAADTTTADFVEGAGNQIAVGANIGVVDVGTDQAPSYKFDILAGIYDVASITNSDIDSIFTPAP